MDGVNPVGNFPFSDQLANIWPWTSLTTGDFMRPVSPVRYVSTPRSPSRLRATAHAPHFKTKQTAVVEISLTNNDIKLKRDELGTQILPSIAKQNIA
ncbi:hypothetical protein [Photobacterium angustum]|nr:hypothetical protein [Photobacterium angustum]